MKIKTIFDKRPLSDNPLDHYLSVVFCEIENEHTPYVTWEYNSETNGYFSGHYFFKDEYEDALKDYLER